MNFRCPIPACVLFGILLIVMVGCEKPGDVPNPGTPPPPTSVPAPKTDDRDTYDELFRERLELQEKFAEAMELYQTTSLKIDEQQTEFQNLLGNKSVSEVIELFNHDKINEVPSDLRVAYSCWQKLILDETLLSQITMWIEKHLGLLEELDIQIKEFENDRQLGKFFVDTEKRAKIDRLLAQRSDGWDTVTGTNKERLKQKAIDNLKTKMTNKQ